ncbi:protein sel-1 homolog 3 [Genypterus blacodes]|uniref:protein sel-1 homolog 3 n=1 Tax=Genypterus blacodes TaxID=154954 RepID=UPI003F7576EC
MDYHRLYTHICLFYLTLQIVRGLDEVTFLNPPQEPVSSYWLEIFYSCDYPAAVQLDFVVAFDAGKTSTTTLRHWSCVPGTPKIRTLELILPDWLVYQPDGIVPESRWVLSCILKVSIRYNRFSGETYIIDQHVAVLYPIPPLSRPVKQHKLCSAWGAQMLQVTRQYSKKRCLREEETVPLLSSIYASTGENFGITKTLQPYSNDVLESLRVDAISFPWCLFSIWIYVTRHCQESLCGVFHHISSSNAYVTPALFLATSGRLHIQVNGELGESSALLSPFKVPLREWCHLTLTLHGKWVTVSMVSMDDKRLVQSVEHEYKHPVMLDDTKGYFVIGGGKYTRGVEGYFGPLVYYRNRIPHYDMSEVVIPDVIKEVNLPGWLKACQHFQLEMDIKISGYTQQAKQQRDSGESCSDTFHRWVVNDRQPLKLQCEPWEASLPKRRHAAKLAKLLAFKRGGRGVSPAAVGRALYSLSLHKLDRGNSSDVVSRILPLLLQAACLADNQSLHLSSVLYSSVLGLQKQPNKAWLLALLAAQKDDRLSLLHLGRMHLHGDHGIPPDPDLAYAYYANIAKQTVFDRLNPSARQTFVEAVYLNNDEALQLQTNEDHHIFHWLKLQAYKGVADAEQTVGRLLFWGQQGVAPDLERAARHYQRGAVHLENPVSMYDYGIVLLQGYGVKKDIQKAVVFLKKAMEKGYTPAINALGWYYEQYERNYVRAVEFWEQADRLGNADAALNLGVLHSQGLYPGRAADEVMAFKYYMKAAEREHITGAVHVANFWTTGISGHVNRRVSDAILFAKWAAEHNGYLGSVLRKALDFYLKGDMLKSLLHYMMAAESGYEPAQFNVAYLCDQNPGQFLDAAFASDCMRRYYNLTIQNQNPETYAFIRLGDLLYEGQGERQKVLFSAAQMYKQAALHKNPQGWFNLGLLAEEGYRLPLSVLIELGLSELYLADNVMLLEALFERCRDSDDADSYLPCSLALYNVYVQSIQKDFPGAIKFSTAAAVVAAPAIYFLIRGVLGGRTLSRH